MTAPGTEPDEVLTGEPVEEERPDAEPDLLGIGDNLMPEDLRAAERERGTEPAEREPGTGPAERDRGTGPGGGS